MTGLSEIYPKRLGDGGLGMPITYRHIWEAIDQFLKAGCDAARTFCPDALKEDLKPPGDFYAR